MEENCVPPKEMPIQRLGYNLSGIFIFDLFMFVFASISIKKRK
jgi:hypothetical protein